MKSTLIDLEGVPFAKRKALVLLLEESICFFINRLVIHDVLSNLSLLLIMLDKVDFLLMMVLVGDFFLMIVAFLCVRGLVVENLVHIRETGTFLHHARHSLDSVEAFQIFIHGVAAAVVVIVSLHFSGLILHPSLLLRNMW